MGYKTVKVGERIIFVPDEELKNRLRQKMRIAKRVFFFPVRTEISMFRRPGGLRLFLKRHGRYNGRFFVLVDFVYAFHQITRERIAKVFPRIADSFFDDCFVELSGKQVLPIGFPSSSWLFEIFCVRAVDGPLIAWAEKHRGVVTRYTDNILVTWKKNTQEAFSELVHIFDGLNVRFTPLEPRKWDDKTPIRFCGFTLQLGGMVGLSLRRVQELERRAGEEHIKSQLAGEPVGTSKSARGIERFIKDNGYDGSF